MPNSKPHDTFLVTFADEDQEQARLLSQHLGIERAQIQVHYFPDGECRITLPEMSARQLILLRCLDHPNSKLVELMLAAGTARRLGCKDLTLIAPYLCYMRQDAAFKPGEAISQEIIGKFLSDHVDQLITVDAHLHRISELHQAVPAHRALNITAAQQIGRFIAQQIDKPVLLGPDSESQQWVHSAAEPGQLPWFVADKQRLGDRRVQIQLPDMPVKQRNIVIVDDMASTGETIMQAALLLQQRGAASVSCALTHALFDDNIYSKMRQSGIQAIWSCNTVSHPTNRVDITPLLAQAWFSVQKESEL
ncbi:MAG: ribose-phosphate diphosphokinase [Gammaproteobacteria bacterium]|nr:ribose-phosphate diphosphokinase [Gammaproteobacteria bacterium]MDH5802955.1 ribose-phosphate diphosphokinase [Gammaproteobacteria bacterium]